MMPGDGESGTLTETDTDLAIAARWVPARWWSRLEPVAARNESGAVDGSGHVFGFKVRASW